MSPLYNILVRSLIYTLCSKYMLHCTALVPYRKIYIDQVNQSSDYIHHVNNDTVMLCRSFSQMNKLITNSTQVVVVGEYLNLSTIVTFENVQNLNIVGYDKSSKAIIRCKTGENAGIELKHIESLSISNISIQNCGALHATNTTVVYIAALYFESCANVCIMDTEVLNNNGIGVIMRNVRGNVTIMKTIVKNNRVTEKNGGGGMYIELNICPCSNSVYKIDNCTFSGNQALTNQTYLTNGAFRTLGQGGGLLISPQKNCTNNTFYITNSMFYNNTAVWGGGLHLFFAQVKSDNLYSNRISIANTTFDDNVSKEGGGGMVIYYYLKYHKNPHVHIHVHKCNFTSNHAKQGGGMLVLISAPTSGQKHNTSIEFEDCLWNNNQATFSSAVDITGNQGYAGIVDFNFFNCEFVLNKVHPVSTEIHDPTGKHVLVTHYGNSAFMVTFGKVRFKGYIRFIKNNGPHF